MDVAIIDTPWNGVAESLKIAAMADAYEVNVAPHNFYGHLATMMSAHFCAVVPNFRIMEIDPDTVPWYDELVTIKPGSRAVTWWCRTAQAGEPKSTKRPCALIRRGLEPRAVGAARRRGRGAGRHHPNRTRLKQPFRVVRQKAAP